MRRNVRPESERRREAHLFKTTISFSTARSDGERYHKIAGVVAPEFVLFEGWGYCCFALGLLVFVFVALAAV